MTRNCEWFRFTKSYTGEHCDSVPTTSIHADGDFARVCAAHEVEWNAHVANWNAQQREFGRQDRMLNYLSWGATILAVGLDFYFAGPMIGLLTLIAGGVLYVALKISQR